MHMFKIPQGTCTFLFKHNFINKIKDANDSDTKIRQLASLLNFVFFVR